MSFDSDQPAFQSLRKIVAERTGDLVVWIGSGLSVPAGLPDWGDLRNRLTDELTKKAATMDEEGEKRLSGQVLAAEQQQNPWQALEILEDGLGRTSFRDAVRHSLSPADSAPLPPTYLLMWQLAPSGVISLNLDRLATRAYSQERGGTALIEVPGLRLPQAQHLLKSPHPFLVNLHGDTWDESSWVLTNSQLKALRQRTGYAEFLTAIFSSRTVFFLGISADDVAAGGFLADLRRRGFDLGTHFWLTDRQDLDTDRWAEDAGIRVIRYDGSAGHQPVVTVLEELESYVSEDDVQEPVVPRSRGEQKIELPPPRELEQKEAEEIRWLLNERAIEILENSEDPYEAFREFTDQYDGAIYRAWYTTAKPPDNVLLGYDLAEEVAAGAFGKVFRAPSPDGGNVAIKVLHEGIRKEDEMLQTFRRGVRSMEILTRNEIDGMVAFREASEIPAFVVMDWVNGPTLDEAVQNRYLGDWNSILSVALQLADIVHSAHRLPQRVLHRDLRPRNVMLRNYYMSEGELDLAVLDFDLSWHKGAPESSVIHGMAPNGYLAPEQIQRIPGVSTRSAAVDSFGFGMTLFFMLARRNPLPSEHATVKWADEVERATRTPQKSHWKSLPARIGRLILNCTRDRQSLRWDMGQVLRELERLARADLFPDEVRSPELAAEELGARTGYADEFAWDTDEFTALLNLPTGLQVALIGRDDTSAVRLELEWNSRGVIDRRKEHTWLAESLETLQQRLARGGWKVGDRSSRLGFLRITAEKNIDLLATDLGSEATVIDELIEGMRMSGY